MSDTTEYAVMTRRAGRETVDGGTITTDIGRARLARGAQQAHADYLAENGDAAKAECVLVMRTCTPWCEVCEHDPFERKDGLPDPDHQASVGMEQARQVQESARDFLHRQAQARNAAAQQDPGLPVRTYELCPHCQTPVRYVITRRGKRVVVCDRCGPINLIGGDRIPTCRRPSNAGPLCIVTAVAVLCIITCMVCTAISCRALNEVRSGELTREARTK